MPFPCPHCKADTTTIISRPGVEHMFCPSCRPENSLDKKLYSGRKFWAGSEVYTKEQLKEKAHNFEQTTMARVREDRKRMRPSLRKKLYGE